MSAKKYAYDAACEALAEYFLTDTSRKDLAPDLAQHIQEAVEDWVSLNFEEPT
jgi:hypothetical protein